MTKPTRLDYCQYLQTTPINYTLTHFADHCERFSYDQINRYLAGDHLPPRYVWESVKPHLEQRGNHVALAMSTFEGKCQTTLGANT